MTIAVAVRGGAPNAVNMAGISTVFSTTLAFLGEGYTGAAPGARRRAQADCRGGFSVGAGQDALGKPLRIRFGG